MHIPLFASLTNGRKYNRNFFEELTQGSLRSAALIMPDVIALLNPKSVADVGCGVGCWLAAVRDCGIIDTLGIDGTYVPRDRLRIPLSGFYPWDLANPLQLSRRFDLSICLEVAEHLDESRADSLVDDLTRIADAVLFSAAIPGQFGTGHVNEQWPEYWGKKFLTNGYFALDLIRERFWDRAEVETHYKQNCILYLKKETFPQLMMHEAAVKDGHLRRLIHPTLYTTYMRLSHPISALVFRSRRSVSGRLPPTLKRAVRRLLSS